MHSFSDLIERSTSFTLYAIEQAQQSVLKEFETSGGTVHLKNLQMFQLQKAIYAVGMFSIFEAHLQQYLNCAEGFKEARKILLCNERNDIESNFHVFYLSINVLKHGRGKSYDQLLVLKDTLPFNIKYYDESFFEEGDVSEVMTLIYVDDYFLKGCATIIQEVNDAIREVKPGYFG